MKVEVYWNLHKKLYSVRHPHGKLIEDNPHRMYVELEDVVWVVQQGGREGGLKEREKNVHAFARGPLVEGPVPPLGGPLKGITTLKYNPYMHQTFIDADSEQGTPVRTSKLGIMFLKTNGSPAVWALGASQ